MTKSKMYQVAFSKAGLILFFRLERMQTIPHWGNCGVLVRSKRSVEVRNGLEVCFRQFAGIDLCLCWTSVAKVELIAEK